METSLHDRICSKILDLSGIHILFIIYFRALTLPVNKMLALSELKAFVDDKLTVTKNIKA